MPIHDPMSFLSTMAGVTTLLAFVLSGKPLGEQELIEQRGR